MTQTLAVERTEPTLPLISSRHRIAYFEPHWYAAYTRANHEKQIARQLQERGIECFLPLYETVHRWKDRHRRLQLPLFPSYVFVRLPLCDRLQVLQVPSVVRFVGFGDLPALLPEVEIESLRKGLRGAVSAHPHPYLTTGRRVRIRSGPLTGMEGVFLRRKNGFHVVISIELIMRSIALELDIADVVPLHAIPVTQTA